MNHALKCKLAGAFIGAVAAFGWRQGARHALKRSNPADAAPPTSPSA